MELPAPRREAWTWVEDVDGKRVPSWARSIWLGFKGWGNFDVQVWAGQVRFLRWMGF